MCPRTRARHLDDRGRRETSLSEGVGGGGLAQAPKQPLLPYLQSYGSVSEVVKTVISIWSTNH